MAKKYESAWTPVNAPAQAVYSRFSNLENLSSLLANIPAGTVPADKKELIDQIEVTADTLRVPGGPVGAITLRMTRKEEPSLIVLEGENTPVPLSLSLEIRPVSDNSSEVKVAVELEVPAMLAPMVAGPVKKMVEQFATVIQAVPYN